MSIVIVTALWAGSSGLTDLLSTGQGVSVTSLARLSGLVAADLLLLQVLAMARIPWVERSFGLDRLARWHRWAGFTSFNLMLGHVALVTVGYALTARVGVLPELWRLVWTYPGVLLATAAAGLLSAVAVLSVKAARRRLRYESWHLIHLYAYLGVGLALPHQLWTGTDFIASPAARVYWWGLYLATLGAVLTFRVGLPLWRNVRHRLVVSAVVDEAPASSRSTCAVATSTGCPFDRASSSSGVSSTARAGHARTPTPCRRLHIRGCFASPSRTSATAHARRRRSGPGPGP